MGDTHVPSPEAITEKPKTLVIIDEKDRQMMLDLNVEDAAWGDTLQKGVSALVAAMNQERTALKLKVKAAWKVLRQKYGLEEGPNYSIDKLTGEISLPVPKEPKK